MKITTLLLFLLINIAAFSQTAPITTAGQIKDNTGTPVPFAAVFQQKTNKGTYADSLGHFTMATQMGDTLTISAIGFGGKKYIVNGKTDVTINLKKETNTLADVKVTANSIKTDANQPTIIEQQVISHTISDYRLGENINNGTLSTMSAMGGNMPRSSADQKTMMSTAVGIDRVYHGAFLPVFTHTDATKGSPLLFETWTKGYVINTSGVTIANDSYFFNFDKLSQNLLMTQDKKNMIEVDRAIIKTIDLNADGKEYIFEKRIVNNEPKLLMVLAKSEKYALYKANAAKFEKANYNSTGLTETGHNYDLYFDKPTYYLYSPITNQVKQIDLKKKSIKEAIPQDQAKVDAYFSQHSDMPVNEDFVIGLVISLK